MPDENISVAETESEVSDDGAEQKDWPAEAQKFQDLYLRSAAEMENMRRRFQKEMDDKARFAAEKIVKELLPVMDNLGLALDYVKDDAPAEVLCLSEGVRMTLKGFQDVMADNGVKAVEVSRGQPFDPNVHEAIGQCQESDIPSGAISQEVQKGYMLYDRLVRPAKVIVAAGE
jgi:molecular chaperone GrpE